MFTYPLRIHKVSKYSLVEILIVEPIPLLKIQKVKKI